jgi:hypothetical protein
VTEVRDMVMETTVTQGTVASILGGAVAGYSAFADKFANGAELFYTRRQRQGAWETCRGVLTYGPPVTITRLETLDSTIGPATPVNWGEGTAIIYCSLPASQILLAENALSEIADFLIADNLLSEIAALGGAAKDTALGNLGATATGRGILKAADAAAVRTLLALGSAALLTGGTSANNLLQLNGTGQIPAVDGSLITGLPSGPIPAGAVMVFYMTAAPAGWTRITTIEDRVLRVRSGAGAGTTTANTWAINDLTADGIVLTVNQIPSHSHTRGDFANVQSGSGSSVVSTSIGGVALATGSTGGGLAHDHPVSSPGAWRPPVVDVLLASKN